MAQDVERTLSGHTVCYPPAEPDTLLEPLYPDRLGEDFVALQTAGHSLPDYAADDWAAQAPARLLVPTGPESDSASPPSWSRPALTVLIETSLRWRHVAESQLYPLLTAHPRLARAAGGAALARLTEIERVDLRVLKAIEPHLPRLSVDLAPATAAITRVLTADRLKSTDDSHERAQLYITLAGSLLVAGLHEEALPEITEATLIWRRLAQPAHEAVMIRRRHVRANRRAHIPVLADILDNLSALYAGLGQRQRARELTEEAVGLYREAVGANPAAHTPALAIALNNLAIGLS
ncbi:tetratricopeptide repeat protein [Streptomyces sp. NPDC006463]|uniref:tetratricopeptide repeat protein n=1 Tax=Streptomyces sp. NPDC006463 TaxID=3364746 RepID=UPI0036BBCEF0